MSDNFSENKKFLSYQTIANQFAEKKDDKEKSQKEVFLFWQVPQLEEIEIDSTLSGTNSPFESDSGIAHS